VYGDSGGQSAGDVVAVSVDPGALSRILHSDAGVNTLIGLAIDAGQPTQVLIKDYQLHPITRKLLHVDFYRLAMSKVITVSVRVVLKGEAEGVKMQAGLVAFEQREFAIACLPTEIPEHVEVDISSLMIGHGVRVRDLLEGVSWTPVTDPDTLIVHVVAPKVEEEPEAEEEAAAEGEAAPEAEGAEEAEKADDAGKSGD
jgi:large subunit ribosomal protein L25